MLGEDVAVRVGKVGLGELVVVAVGRSICTNISGVQPTRQFRVLNLNPG